MKSNSLTEGQSDIQIVERRSFPQKTLQNFPDYCFYVKPDKSFTTEYISSGVELITGFSVKDFIDDQSVSLFSIIHADDKDRVLNQLSFALENKLTFEMSFRIHTKMGEEKWLWQKGNGIWDEAGNLIAIEGFATDFTETKRAENVIKEQGETLQNIFYFSPIPMIITRIDDGMIMMVNEGAEKLFGFNKIELIGKHTSKLYSDKNERTEILLALNQNKKIFNRETQIRNEKNEIISCLLSIEIIKLKGERRYLKSFTDITERKINEIALNKSLEIVTEQNNRLLNFSYIVSHNLRSHTSNILSLINFLEREKSEIEKVNLLNHLKIVSNLLNETLYNLNEVISINKNLNTTIDKLNLHDYINQAMDVLKKDILLKNATVINLVPADCSINHNPAYLESILLNFLSNAVKYASPNRQPEIKFEAKQTNQLVELSISDNGLGIDLKKFNDRLFGMYKTFHGNKDARGIGLFITKNQIDAMGGKIEVTSEVNKGTTFKISFL